MDLRISADADIKRLREMVQKLEEKNTGLKTLESPRLGRESATRYTSERMNASPVLSKVAVKLNLDDVPLLDLSDVDSEEEDSWLYMSPIYPPTPAQKSISPYKYLKGNIDHQTDLNRVRGSLMAKLESIAAQEESISRHDHQESQVKDRNSADMNRTNNMEESNCRNDFEEEIDLKPLNISGSETYPVRRRGTPTGTPLKPPQTKLYKAWENLSLGDDDLEDDPNFNEAPVVRRRAPKPFVPGKQLIGHQDEQDSGVVRPRGASNQNFSIEIPSDEDENDVESAPVVRRRGVTPRTATPTGQSIARMHDHYVPVAARVRVRGQPQQNFTVNPPSDDEEEVNEVPFRRRGAARQSLPVGRIIVPQMPWEAEDDDDNSAQVRPRRRAAPVSMYRDDGDAEFDNQAPVVRRRSPASPKPLTDDNLVVTAVRRRGAPQADNQVRPRGGIPTPSKGPKACRLRVSQDAEMKRRSLPQVPTSSLQYPSSTYSENVAPRVRSASPAGRLAQAPVVPRQSKLVTPRRIPTPRTSNSYYSTGNEENWRYGCY